MDPLVLIAAVAAALVVLHVVVATYLYRAAAGSDNRAPSAGENPERDRVVEPLGQGDEDEHRTPCPACGTPNDPTYRFCRQCVADLSNAGSAVDGPDATKRLGS